MQGTGGQVSLAFGDGPTDRLGKAGVGVEEMLHSGVADLQHFGFFQRDDVCGSRFSGKERHLTEEVTFTQDCDGAWSGSLEDLDFDAAIIYYEHGRALVARANQGLAGREDVTNRRRRELS